MGGASHEPGGGDERRVVPGWEGRLFDDFTPGDTYYHPFGRTLTDVDNQWFTLLTQNVARTHVDRHFAAHTDFGRPLVNSAFVLALIVGQSTIDLTMNVYANLGWDEVRLPHPVFEGDTLYSRSEVVATRPSESRPHVGVVDVHTEGFNQDGRVVITFRRSFMVYRRGHLPTAHLVQPEAGALLDRPPLDLPPAPADRDTGLPS
jgi:acyl dehydratase